MAKKTAQIDIKLTGVNTIQGLEDELEKINEQIKNVDVNSQAFKTLSEQSILVKTALHDAGLQLENVTGREKAESIHRMGSALVGAFQGAAGASLLFGEKAGKDYQALIGKVVGLYSAIDGVTRFTKAFSTENISRLKALGIQWGLVGTDAKIAGMSMKTALISTGIGALVVALGMLIANWDKITAAIKINAKEKALAEDKVRLEEELKTQQDLLKAYEEEATAQKAINALNGDKKANAQVDLDLTKKKTAEIQAQQAVAINAEKLLNIEKEKAEEKLKAHIETLESQKSLQDGSMPIATANLKIYEKSVEVAQDNLKVATDALKVNKEQQTINEKNLWLLEKQAVEAQNLLDFQQKMLDVDKEIAAGENRVKILQAEEGTTVVIYEQQKKILDLQIQKLHIQDKINGYTNDESKQAIKNLEVDKQAIGIKEALFIKNLDYQTRINTLNKLYNDALKENNTEINQANLDYDVSVQKLERLNQIIELQSQNYSEVLKGYQEYSDFQLQSLELGTERIKQLEEEQNFIAIGNSDLKVTIESYEKIAGYVEQRRIMDGGIANDDKARQEALNEFGKTLHKTYEYEIEQIENKRKGLKENASVQEQIDAGIILRDKYTEEELQKMGNYQHAIRQEEVVAHDKITEKLVQELALKKTILGIEDFNFETQLKQNKNLQDQLNANEDLLNGRQILVNGYIRQLEAEKASLEASKKSTDSAEKRGIINDKILALEGNIVNANNESYQINNDLYKNKQDQVKVDTDITTIQGQKVTNAKAQSDAEKQTTAELEKQEKWYAKANDWIKQNAEEIQAYSDLINQMFSLAIAAQQRNADKADERIKRAQKNLDALNKKEKKYEDDLKDLQDELKDADGERYNELLAKIAEVEAANVENGKTTQQRIKDETNAQLKAQYDKDMAEWHMKKLEKEQALIAATIAGALAVVKALPNVVLAVLVGVLSAASIATIALQRIPPQPEKPTYEAKGGLLKGKSHAEGGIPVGDTGIEVEGGEMVVNRRATAMYLPLLTTMNDIGNKKKFDVGGQMSPNISTKQTNDLIDYERLAQEIGKLNISVSVVDINRKQQQVKVIQSNASI